MPIPKPFVLIQLMVNDRTAWQVKTEVDPKLCRKMTSDELDAIGTTVANELGAIMNDRSDADPTFKKVAGADQPKKKR